MIYDIQIALESIDGAIEDCKRELKRNEGATDAFIAHIEGRIGGMMFARNRIKNALKSARKREAGRNGEE